MVEKDSFDSKFLKAIGFGKQESEWITQYDGFPIRGGFLSDYAIVGRESPTNAQCGKHRQYMKCSETALHEAIDGRDFYHNCVTNCKRYQCHTCWKYGWCVLRANIVESRFFTAEKLLGLDHKLVEHVVVSVPKRLYGLSPQEMVHEAISACKRSGVPSGVAILHPFRKDQKRRDLYKAFHYHVLGYVDGGYDRCRACIKVGCCWTCDGFEGVTRRAHGHMNEAGVYVCDDGWIVKMATNEAGVVEKRDSIFGTAWYQLEHSGYKNGVRNFHIVVWFGVVAKRKFKTEIKRFHFGCAVCKSDLHVAFLPRNCEPIVANRREHGFLKNFTLPHVDEDDKSY